MILFIYLCYFCPVFTFLRHGCEATSLCSNTHTQTHTQQVQVCACVCVIAGDKLCIHVISSETLSAFTVTEKSSSAHDDKDTPKQLLNYSFRNALFLFFYFIFVVSTVVEHAHMHHPVPV